MKGKILLLGTLGAATVGVGVYGIVSAANFESEYKGPGYYYKGNWYKTFIDAKLALAKDKGVTDQVYNQYTLTINSGIYFGHENGVEAPPTAFPTVTIKVPVESSFAKNALTASDLNVYFKNELSTHEYISVGQEFEKPEDKFSKIKFFFEIGPEIVGETSYSSYKVPTSGNFRNDFFSTKFLIITNTTKIADISVKASDSAIDTSVIVYSD